MIEKLSAAELREFRVRHFEQAEPLNLTANEFIAQGQVVIV
jgi:hypothetical protein